MTLSEIEKAALKKLVAKLKEQFQIKQIMLFGSRARNEQNADSDIDILLLVQDPVDDKVRWKLSDIVTEVEWATDIYFSCRIYNVLDWENENENVIFLPFKDNVVRDGELLEI